MDSLIVLRRPLRKTQVEPKLIIPKKSKKAQTKLAPIPPSPESTERPISFVKLYKEVCVENARYWPPCVGNLPESGNENTPTRVQTSRPPRSQLSAARGHVNSPASCSATSLLTQYTQYAAAGRRLSCHPPPFNATKAELVLELDYDSRFREKDSAFASIRNSFF